jgi:hypothetical protein
MSDEGLFLRALTAEVMAALDAYYHEDTPYQRRNVARVFGSAVEGETFFLKQLCLRRLDSEPAFYSTGEAALLRESAYYLDRDSSVQALPQFLSAAENFHFALKAFVKDTLPDLDVREDTAGWGNFKNAFRIRNRVTHPTAHENLLVSDRDLGCVQRAFLWFRKTLEGTLVLSSLKLHDQYDRVRSELQLLGHDARPLDSRVIPRQDLLAWAARLDRAVIPPLSDE